MNETIKYQVAKEYADSRGLDWSKEWNRPMKKLSFWKSFICLFKGHIWGFVSILQSLPRMGCKICQRCGTLGGYILPTKEQLKDCWNE